MTAAEELDFGPLPEGWTVDPEDGAFVAPDIEGDEMTIVVPRFGNGPDTAVKLRKVAPNRWEPVT